MHICEIRAAGSPGELLSYILATVNGIHVSAPRKFPRGCGRAAATHYFIISLQINATKTHKKL